MTTNPSSIHERMVAVLADLPAIGKNQVNQQQNFKFRGIDDVLNALNPLLAKHGVFYVPEVIERLDSERTTSRGSAMFVVHLHVRYTFYGAAGDFVTASAWGEGTDMGDKATPKAMTGAMKACLFQAFAISTEETTDPDSATPEDSKPSNKPKISSASPKTPPPAAAPESEAKGSDASSPAAAVSEDEEVTRLRRRWNAIAKGLKKTEDSEREAIIDRWHETTSLDDLDAAKWEAEIEHLKSAPKVGAA